MSTTSNNTDPIGTTTTANMFISEEKIRAIAEASGDENPLHLDDDYAEQTRFRGRIAHGILVEGTISAALAELPGVIAWLEKDVTYLKPVRPGECIEARVEVVEHLGDGRYRVEAPVVTVSGETVIESEHTILVDDDPDDDTEAGAEGEGVAD